VRLEKFGFEVHLGSSAYWMWWLYWDFDWNLTVQPPPWQPLVQSHVEHQFDLLTVKYHYKGTWCNEDFFPLTKTEVVLLLALIEVEAGTLLVTSIGLFVEWTMSEVAVAPAIEESVCVWFVRSTCNDV